MSVSRGSANDAAAVLCALDPREIALLLDVDGTLLDIAPAPDAVDVPQSLRETLARLLAATSGAMALVSGRAVSDLDRLFAPLVLPAIGGHGAEMRIRPGEKVEGAPPLPSDLREALMQAASFDPGLYREDKGYSVALHYRNAPAAKDQLADRISTALAHFASEAVEVLEGKAVFEVKRAGLSKGSAVRLLIKTAPFAGRQPVFAGDDVTDESVFAALPELGGLGFSVQRAVPGVAGIFSSPNALRTALAHLAAKG